MINARIVNAADGSFIHSGQLPEAPQCWHQIRIHDRDYQVQHVVWNMTPGFGYQNTGMVVEVLSVDQVEEAEAIDEDQAGIFRGGVNREAGIQHDGDRA